MEAELVLLRKLVRVGRDPSEKERKMLKFESS